MTVYSDSGLFLTFRPSEIVKHGHKPRIMLSIMVSIMVTNIVTSNYVVIRILQNDAEIYGERLEFWAKLLGSSISNFKSYDTFFISRL